MAELSGDERVELERLRARFRERRGPGGAARVGRWLAAWAVLLVAALLGGLAVVAVYVRSELLDTAAYVQTVAPLGTDPTVRNAVAQRLTDEIVTRSDIKGLANRLAAQLEAGGAPRQVSDLVNPLIGGVSSLLNHKINDLMTTDQFEAAWNDINRAAHQGLVTVLTGQKGRYVSSQGDTVTIDLGELLSLVKQKLVDEGLTILGKIPDVSIPYTLVQSDQLPKVRKYTQFLDAAGTWLPWLALVLFIGGILLAPNRRRGVIVGFVLLGIGVAELLAALSLLRSYYVDNLPPSVRSPEAATIVIDTVLRFLVASLETVLVASLVFVVGALLAGPSTPAVWLRTWLGRGFDALGGLLRRTGGWAAATGRAVRRAHHPIQIGLVVLAVVGFILAVRPGVSAVLWTTFVVLLLLVVMEAFVRAAGGGRPG
jgi:hypothetical protein